jgi:hypothetical protein
MASVQEGGCQVEGMDVINSIRASSSGGFIVIPKQQLGIASHDCNLPVFHAWELRIPLPRLCNSVEMCKSSDGAREKVR